MTAWSSFSEIPSFPLGSEEDKVQHQVVEDAQEEGHEGDEAVGNGDEQHVGQPAYAAEELRDKAEVPKGRQTKTMNGST